MSATGTSGKWPLRLVEVGGPARERGRALGQALRDDIRGHVAAWRDSIATRGGVAVDEYVAGLLADTDFKPAIREAAPELLDEVEGMAEGAGLAPDQLYALQLLDEEWAYHARRGAARTGSKCSSFAIADPDGPTWIGQNMDLGDYTDGRQVMLKIAADRERPAALVFTTAGMIGLMGVNAAGVGVCVNALPQLANAPTGVPVAFVLRRLLQARDLDEASRLVVALPHATNQHYVLASPDGVRSFEASAAGVVAYEPPDPARVFHTNHPLAAPAEREGPTAWENSETRLRSLTARLCAGKPHLQELQGALCAKDDAKHPVCRDGSGLFGFTTGSMISALTPSRVSAWASAGPPDTRGYHAFELTG